VKGQGNTITISELEQKTKFNLGYNGYCSIDGVAITQIGNERETFIDSAGKTTDYVKPIKEDGRSVANRERTGKKLKRNGKYVRSTEVRRTVIAWVGAIGGISKVKFTTVSFPCGIADDLAKQCFNVFLTRWRKAVPEVSYLWTAERQKNGTLHFHMVHDRYIEIRKLNGWMRKTLVNKSDQIEGYTKQDLERYNGVDIGSKVYSKIGIEKYLAKYLTKAQKSGINQPWHRSRKMGNLATKVRFSIDRVQGMFRFLKLSEKTVDQELFVMESEYCLYVSFPPALSKLVKWHLDKYNQSRWRGVSQQSKYPFPVLDVEQSTEKHSLQIDQAGSIEQLKLELEAHSLYSTRKARWSNQRIL